MLRKSILSLTALISIAALIASGAVPAHAQSSSDHIISRGYAPGMYSFTCYHNFLSGLTLINTLQVVQGPFNVTSAIDDLDVSYYADSAGCHVGHIEKDGYLNGLLAYPVRIYIDVKMVNAMYKAGTFRWKVTNRPSALIQKTWMDSAKIYGAVDSFVSGYYKADVYSGLL